MLKRWRMSDSLLTWSACAFAHQQAHPGAESAQPILAEHPNRLPQQKRQTRVAAHREAFEREQRELVGPRAIHLHTAALTA